MTQVPSRSSGLGHPALKSAPLAVLDTAVRYVRKRLAIDRYRIEKGCGLEAFDRGMEPSSLASVAIDVESAGW